MSCQLKTERSAGGPSSRVLRWTRVGVWVAWALLILVVLSSAIGENAVQPSMRIRLIQLALLPEGWAFFTRDPQEPTDVVYRRFDDGLMRLTFPNTSGRSLFGISRSARAFDVELTALLAPVLASSWSACDANPGLCASQNQVRPLEAINWSMTRFICDEVAVHRRPPVPWAWSQSRSRIHMASKILLLNVDCSREPSVERQTSKALS